MKGKIIRNAILIFLLFIATGLTASANASAESNIITNQQEKTIIVDKNGNGDYTTIQEAINNAPEGSTLLIKEGTYCEILNIKKKINLQGEDKNKVIINPISEKNKCVLRLGAPGIKISKLSITNGAPGLYATGIKISASKAEIKDCNIYDTPIGIAIWSSNNIISNCAFWGCDDEGIALLGSKLSKCDNNKITSSIFYSNCDGIELQYSSYNLIKNCEIYDNSHTGIDAIGSSNDKNIISNCKIYNNEVHGIYLSSSSDNKIIDCLISDNKDGDIITNEQSKNNNIINLASIDSIEKSSDKIENPIESNNRHLEQQDETNQHEQTKNNILFRILEILSNYNLLNLIIRIKSF